MWVGPQAGDQRTVVLSLDEEVYRLAVAELRRLNQLEEEESKAQAVGDRPGPDQEDAAGRAVKKCVKPARRSSFL